jgi:membrane fusion protein, heavy metal efflux system
MKLYIQLLAIACLATFGCNQHAPHDGFEHDENGNHIEPTNVVPSIKCTVWTDDIELFVEYNSFVTGESSRFAAHFTLLENHKPLSEGTLKVSLINGSETLVSTTEAPAEPGIFIIDLVPKTAGIGQLIFEIEGSGHKATMEVGPIHVFSSKDEAIAAKSAEAAPAISLTKEQAWQMDFHTEEVTVSAVHTIYSTSGIWRQSPKDFKNVVSPASGTVSLGNSSYSVGTAVQKGQHILTISGKGLTSKNMAAQIESARASYEQAQSEYNRKKELFEAGILPKSEFEVVEEKYLSAKAEYDALSTGYAGEGTQVMAPFDGYIKSITATNGDFVDEGAQLLVITKKLSGLLEAQVSPDFSSKLGSIRNLWYQPSPGFWSNTNETGGSILSIGTEVSDAHPMLPVFVQVHDAVEMPEGSFTEVRIAYGDAHEAVTVPESALLEDFGAYSVIVQVSGEGYERRSISIGNRSGDQVEVTSGLLAGERVVSHGAYLVKMASMSSQIPSHGHSH